MTTFVKAGDALLHPDAIEHVDCSRIEELIVEVKTASLGTIQVTGTQAVELIMQLRPSMFEGRRLRFIKHGFSIHNLIGHPLMQICAWFRCYKWALRIHDATMPKPRGKKKV